MKQFRKQFFALLLGLLLLCGMLPATLAETVEWQEPDAPQPSQDGDVLQWAETAAYRSPVDAQFADGAERIEDSAPHKRTVRNTDAVDVTAYSYTVTPLLAPFPYVLYVQTDNPDPESFRLVDKESIYYTSEDHAEIQMWVSSNSYYSTEIEAGSYYIAETLFPDVVYENPETYRVNGGYLFLTRRTFSDGGTFVLQQCTEKAEGFQNNRYEDTSVTVPCAPMQNYLDYLIDTYCDPADPFFTRMDAIQRGLEQIAVYPRSVYDSDKPNEERPYPFLATSPYPELSLNEHYNICEVIRDGTLLMSSYPFILDSASFPGTMAAIARKLAPDCTIEGGAVHWQIKVTYQGETRTYGGAGEGGYDPLYTNRVEQSFTFRGGDLGTNATIEGYLAVFDRYRQAAEEDAEAYRDLIAGNTFAAKIRETGGTWIRVATEGFFGYGTTFSYVAPHKNSYVTILNDTWVDNVYVNQCETLSFASFEEHPTADILVHDMSYTDVDGISYRQDVVFSYDAEFDAWTAERYYFNGWYTLGTPLPSEFILTREQVEAMHIGEGRQHLPASGLVYDGTEYPGSPFSNVLVTGVSIPETFTVVAGSWEQMEVTVTPENALEQRVNWESTDPEIAYSEYYNQNYICGKHDGVVTMTAVTIDGQYTDTCVVTVEPNLRFTQEPQDVTIPEHYPATFTAEVEERNDGGGALQLQWQMSSDGKTWTDCAGETKAAVTFETEGVGTRYYRLKAWNTCSEVVSCTATLTVTPYVAPASIITLDPNGGDCTVETVPLLENAVIGVLPVPTRDGYTFKGWYTEPTGGVRIDADWKPTESVTLYAHWIGTSWCYVVFYANGGTCDDSSRWLLTGSDIGELPVPTREGYFFLGWYTAYGNDGELITKTYEVADTIVLYAHWARCGDANGDNRVDSSDAAAVLRHVVGLIELPELEQQITDVDGFRGLTSSDAAAILRYVVKLIPKLPVA